ncbi:MAG TPA: hypothetical protein VM686_33950 [Polyangiaceae bacterium]|nr:hypothetical protein [Polyangiaceae bacterium]
MPPGGEGPDRPNDPVPPYVQSSGSPPPSGAGKESSAADDLADGLDLMLRAARKAMRTLDPRIEETARRALERLEQFDASALSEMGKKAAAKVDPQRLEQVAEEAGREIAGAVERVAQRIEEAISRRAGHEEEKHEPPRKVRIDG